MNELLITIAASVFTLYLVAGYFFWGIPRSISSTYYKIKNVEGRVVFQLTQFVFSICLILTLKSHFFTAAGTFIVFSALAADTRAHENLMKVHVTGAIGGIVLAMAGIWHLCVVNFIGGNIGISFLLFLLPLIQIVFTLYATRKPVKNHTFWIEVLAFYLVCVGLLI
jgi:hypothetical protein